MQYALTTNALRPALHPTLRPVLHPALRPCPVPTQVTGKNPIAALQEHLSDPWSTTIFSKAVVVPGQAVQPPCMIPQVGALL